MKVTAVVRAFIGHGQRWMSLPGAQHYGDEPILPQIFTLANMVLFRVFDTDALGVTVTRQRARRQQLLALTSASPKPLLGRRLDDESTLRRTVRLVSARWLFNFLSFFFFFFCHSRPRKQ